MSSQPELPPVPDPVAELVGAWITEGRPDQPAIPWLFDRWQSYFPDDAAFLGQLPTELDRSTVRLYCADADRSPEEAWRAFLVSMCWGFGNVGYGPYRVRRMVDRNEDLHARLQRTAGLVRSDGAMEGYRYLSSAGRVKWLGPAFGTKFLYFVDADAEGAQALIHDIVVYRSILKRGGPKLRPRRWSPTTYEGYLSTVHHWARNLGVRGEEVEQCLFRAEATGQWGN